MSIEENLPVIMKQQADKYDTLLAAYREAIEVVKSLSPLASEYVFGLVNSQDFYSRLEKAKEVIAKSAEILGDGK